jgi:Serine/threonine protein phosphatase
MSQELPQLATMATTIVALYLNNNVATIGHVGDSRLYRLGENGILVQETADHSVIAEEVRSGRMTPAEAEVHPSRNIISRALGAESTVDVELKTIMVGPGNTFLLCSDGITRHLTDTEIEHFLALNENLETICNRLKEVCYERGAEDNLTAVVIRIGAEIASENGNGARLPADEGEEITVATARQSGDKTSAEFFEADTIEPNPSGTIDDREKAVEPVSEIVNAHNEDEAAAASPFISLSPLDTALRKIETTPASTDATAKAKDIPAPVSETARVKQRNGLGRLLSALLFLVLGAVIGAAGYYFAFPPKTTDTPPPPQITEMKTQNIPLTAFEENRRTVDKNPTAYLAANAANPQDAEDHFLLGRAYLLTGKYWDAKQEFVKSKDQLATVDQNDARTLATEIAMALAIINNGPAQQAFDKDIASQNTAPNPNTAANSATNTAANAGESSIVNSVGNANQ